MGRTSGMDRPAIQFCCPLCKGALSEEPASYGCPACARRYPIVLGIPDFRVFPDPYIEIEADHKKGAFLAERADRLDFLGLVRLYWQITPEVSPDRAERFIARTALLVEKGEACLKTIDSSVEPGRLGAGTRVLEVGCATGGFLVAAKRRYARVVGTDIAFRWLVVARKRLEECGAQVPVVCCCAEYLPFPDDSHDLVIAEGVLEHVRSQEETLHECRRVLSSAGVAFFATANRFAIAPEPHVHLWGVGFMPRAWADRYVQYFRGIPYGHIRVLSVMELRRLLRRCRLLNYRALLPSVSPEEVRQLSAVQRMQVAVFNAVKRVPGLRLVLYLIGPSFNIVVCADDK
ncbi:MAG: methyltransferase domain-containing protein [Nitrospira sp.]|jgi:SAM-dependent methyltransferase/uncharacterized protein YbaR (Trm112 family)|nr:methyltransferase domain-containing protein [Nitrospira sp.]